MRRLAALLACGAAVCESPVAAQPTEQPAVTVTPALSLVTDLLHTRGGAERGNVGLARAEAHLLVDLGAQRSAVLDFGSIDGRSISALVGDAQGTSNIEGPRSTRVFDLFYRWPTGVGRGMATAGIIDLNAFFYVQGDAAATFLNGSHGIGPEFSHSGPRGPSIYPSTSLAALVEQPVGRSTVRLGVFDAKPNAPGAFGGAFENQGGHGVLLVGEVEAGPGRVGAWDYSGGAVRASGTSRGRGDAGGYGVLEFQPRKSLGAWLTAGISNAAYNPVNSYVGGGFLQSLGRLSLGAAVASAGFPGNPRRETTLEFTAPMDLGRGFTVQPDLQVVAHPAGERGTAWVAGVRLRYNDDGTPTPRFPFIRRHRLRRPEPGE